MAGTAMPRSQRGTGVSPVTDWGGKKIVASASRRHTSRCISMLLLPPPSWALRPFHTFLRKYDVREFALDFSGIKPMVIGV